MGRDGRSSGRLQRGTRRVPLTPVAACALTPATRQTPPKANGLLAQHLSWMERRPESLTVTPAASLTLRTTCPPMSTACGVKRRTGPSPCTCSSSGPLRLTSGSDGTCSAAGRPAAPCACCCQCCLTSPDATSARSCAALTQTHEHLRGAGLAEWGVDEVSEPRPGGSSGGCWQSASYPPAVPVAAPAARPGAGSARAPTPAPPGTPRRQWTGQWCATAR